MAYSYCDFLSKENTVEIFKSVFSCFILYYLTGYCMRHKYTYKSTVL